MKKIIIKQLSFVNFKGLRNLTVDFDEKQTDIRGRNGLGKTTIFDGFTWLLFGKDSKDRKTFNLKTLDASNKPIERIPHEVSAVLLVNGEKINLCRRFNEVWKKKRGEAEELFTGHEEERLYNDVPCSLKEWNEKITSICSEEIFKFITNPLYFTSQKSDVQRAMLFRMAGGVTDEIIAGDNEDFKALLKNLTGKSMDEYKREISAKKRRLRDEIDAIPERIDERKRDTPQVEDWAQLESDLEASKVMLQGIEDELSDARKAAQKQSEEAVKRTTEISKLKQELVAFEGEIKQSVQKDYYNALTRKNAVKAEIDMLVNEVKRQERIKSEAQNTLNAANERRNSLLAEYHSISERTLSFNENDFVCPTCHRRFDIGEIEEKQQEITERFNANKANDISKNVEAGKAVKQQIAIAQTAIDNAETAIEGLNVKREELEASKDYNMQDECPDATPFIQSNKERTEMLAKIEKLESENMPTTYSLNTDLQERKSEVQETISSLEKRLMLRGIIQKNNERIAELEKQLRIQSEALAELEGIEYTIQMFSKAKIETVERKINGLFNLVKFKMFEQQINGGEVDTCEAMVDGIPYSDLNNAGKINAGIDIINAICKFDEIVAPVFVDNAEAINQLLPMQSQQIRLVVTEDDTLTIKAVNQNEPTLFNN